MSYSDPDGFVAPDMRVSIVLIALLLGSVGVLFFGPGFENAYVGFGALFAVPFCIGALWTQSVGTYSWLGCLGPPMALMAASVVLVWLGLEGFACVAMVMPVWIVAALGGAAMSVWLKRCERASEAGPGDRTIVRAAGFLVLPFVLMFAERAAPPDWETRAVTRSAVIDAPAEAVWPLLVATGRIGPEEGRGTFTHDWLRIPRPSEARMIARDGALVRLAAWNGGVRFEEHIETFAPPKTLGWRFAFPDDSVQMKTDRHIDPDGSVLRIVSGRYDLTALPDGKTRLSLTTRYRMRSRLGWYFGWWGERFLGDVGVNVVAIISARAEGDRSEGKPLV